MLVHRSSPNNTAPTSSITNRMMPPHSRRFGDEGDSTPSGSGVPTTGCVGLAAPVPGSIFSVTLLAPVTMPLTATAKPDWLRTANGVLAEVQFLSLAACQTNLVLESAALAIRNQSGFAAPLSGIATGAKSVALNIGPGTGAAKPTQPLVGTPLPLGVETTSSPNLVLWGGIILVVMLLVGAALFRLLRWTSKGSSRS